MKFAPLLAAFLLALFPQPALADAGFQYARLADGTEVGIWYPTGAHATPHPIELYSQDVAVDAAVAGTHLPLVVISHGTGGSYAGHYDTALTLANAGFVVAALTHPGDNWQDQSHATDLAARTRALSGLIDYMLTRWSGHAAIDPARVGAFGFSAGGFTVLAAAGGRPDFALLEPHCVAHPDFFDCRLRAAHAAEPRLPQQFTRDARIRALVVAAPAIGFAFGKKGLAGVTMPVQLWRAADDRILPNPYYAEAVRAALPKAPDYHVEPNADHFDFLAPCSQALARVAPPLCASAPGFDRAAFHARLNADVVAFFAKALR